MQDKRHIRISIIHIIIIADEGVIIAVLKVFFIFFVLMFVANIYQISNNASFQVLFFEKKLCIAFKSLISAAFLLYRQLRINRKHVGEYTD